MGSLAAGGAAVMGSGAFNVARVDRSITVGTVKDSSAYLSLIDTSQYASTADGKLKVTIDELNKNANFVMNDVFKIKNRGQDNIIVDLSENFSNIKWDTKFPKAYWSKNELGTTQAVGGDGEFNDNRPIIAPGAEAYVQFEFVGRNFENGGSVADAPNVIGVYAEATNQSANVSSP